MSTLKTTLLVMSFAALIGCRQQPASTKAQMLLDSEVSGKNVTMVRPKETVRPAESIADLKELRTIMQSDIDAAKPIPTKEVLYVKRGESVRPSEKRQ